MTLNLREKTIANIFREYQAKKSGVQKPVISEPKTQAQWVAAAATGATGSTKPTGSSWSPWSSSSSVSSVSSAPWFSSSSITKPLSYVAPVAISSYKRVTAPETGSFFLNLFFYLFMYTFILFLIAVFVHFTIHPIFKFVPGGAGYISVPASTDNVVYWNNKKQPPPSSIAPIAGDKLANHAFTNTFSFSIDLFISQITDTSAFTRLILYKTNKSAILASPSVTDSEGFVNYMSRNASMIMYLTETNDLVVTFFAGNTAASYSCPYIKNVPLYTPFRISVVVEKLMFSIYLNGMLTFQRVFPSELTNNQSTPTLSGQQAFFSAPTWANLPVQTIFVQNFNLWNRIISYSELISAQPALALISDFNIPKDT